MCEDEQRAQRWHPLAALDRADLSTVEASNTSQPFLREARREACCPEPIAQERCDSAVLSLPSWGA